MYARTLQRPKQRRSQPHMFPAPIAGWISNRALATPGGQAIGDKLPSGAAVLDNFFAKATSVVLRRGKLPYSMLGDGTLDVTALFSYNNGDNKHLFGATPEAIYDITDAVFAENAEIGTEEGEPLGTEDGDIFGWTSSDQFIQLDGLTGGNWIVVQFATTGGVYLIGVNGVDPGFIYDGEAFYPNVPDGVSTLDYDAGVELFTEGATLTGATSSATATIWRAVDNGDGTGTLTLIDVAGGPFTDDETITDDEGGDAVANGASEEVFTGMTFGALSSADMGYVWTYKNRLWFAEAGTMNAWYLDDVDSIGGGATIFPLSGVFGRGGELMFGHTWSLEGGAEGGLSEQNIFASSEGEVAVYQGSNPAEAETWAKVGVYRIGKPLGNRAFVRGGGDLAIATSVGLVPLSKAISLDVTSLNIAAISYNIADAWSNAIQIRGVENWQGEIWPEQKVAVFSPPVIPGGGNPVMFVSNTETGAWSRFTNWHALSMEVFDGQLYFGSPGGMVYLANATGQDHGEAYSGELLPLHEDMGSPASLKIAKVARAVWRATTSISDQVSFLGNYSISLPPPPNATQVNGSPSIWDAGQWGASVWDGEFAQVVSEDWRSVGGVGYTCSIGAQITSGAVQPLDAELIRIDVLYDTAEMVT